MTTPTKTRLTFDYEVTATGRGYNAPQKMGRRLWAPMLAMALMAWPVGLILSWVRAAELSGAAADPATVARLGQLATGFMFIGFLGVFSAISFAIARILGAFRNGGGRFQEATGNPVHTLRMPPTATAFMGLMVMGMMAIAIPVVLHFVVAANVGTWTAVAVARWSESLEAFRRLGVTLYLVGITFGLAAIIQVLQFTSIRVRQLSVPTTER